jgi:hypothetical protein
MKLDAAGAAARQYSGDDYKGPYIPGYDYDEDDQADTRQFYIEDLRMASKNYWAARTGQEDPPPPTYRFYHHRNQLGRAMDPYGCQVHMRWARRRMDRVWRSFYWAVGIAFLASFGFTALIGLAVAIVGLIVVGILNLWYRYNYALYYRCQEHCLEIDGPVWEPFTRRQLRQIKGDNFYIWP